MLTRPRIGRTHSQESNLRPCSASTPALIALFSVVGCLVSSVTRPVAGAVVQALFAQFPNRLAPLLRVLCLGWLALVCTACEPQATVTAQLAPATSVPHGVLDIAAGGMSITPRSRAVSAMQTLAANAGVDFHPLANPAAPTAPPMAALLHIDLTRFEPHILVAEKGVRPAEAIARADMAVVIGSSFVSQVRRMQPIGVLQVNGTVLQDVEQHGYTRILGILDEATPADTLEQRSEGQKLAKPHRRFSVIHRSEWLPTRFISALQAGPGIVEEGKLDISERDLQRPRYFRSFVAHCGDSALVGASLAPVHLHTLGKSLVQFFSDQSLNCQEVVNLAGDREAVLVVRHEAHAAFHGDIDSLKAGLIGFSARP